MYFAEQRTAVHNNVIYICSVQLGFVINARHSDVTHADQREVVGVGGDETLF